MLTIASPFSCKFHSIKNIFGKQFLKLIFKQHHGAVYVNLYYSRFLPSDKNFPICLYSAGFIRIIAIYSKDSVLFENAICSKRQLFENAICSKINLFENAICSKIYWFENAICSKINSFEKMQFVRTAICSNINFIRKMFISYLLRAIQQHSFFMHN